MSKYRIVWNESKSEGVIFSESEAGDATHAGGGMPINPVSSLADYFREAYGESDPCLTQIVEIETSTAEEVEKW